MIKQLRVGFQIIKYAYALQATTVLAILLIMCGVLLYFLVPQRGMTVYFFAVNVMWLPQLISSLAVSNMVQSSAWKKKFETSIPALMSFVTGTMVYVVAFLLSSLRYVSAGEDVKYEAMGLLTCSLMMFATMLFNGFTYKFYEASIPVFFLLIWGICFLTPLFWEDVWQMFSMSFGMTSFLAFCIIAVGALAQYGISLLVYRVPLSKRAQYNGLRKWM